MTMKMYQLSNLNELCNIYVYQSIYAKFLALAMSLILLMLSNFEKSSMLMAILAPLDEVIGRIC